LSDEVKIEELVGLRKVKLISGRKVQKPPDLGDVLLLDVELDGKRYRVGALKDGINAVLRHAKKLADGSIELEIPVDKLKEEGIGWINSDY